ncbi:helix-turn-helix transcriptional regulator [Variovorax paradoxus]|uniref:helix-turn-helix transcriptional regulator n=2 Tax=Comamonadaceae TaxID=80864 RepID=UPI000F7F7152|nr:AlpA family phage regulatory protein [Variovorax paradoxus]RTD84973.1 AlpA family phage regulatory protein [Variovorax sp. 369]
MVKHLQDALMRKHEVLRRTGLSNSSLYLLMADGRFPRPVRLGPRTVRWVEREVQNFIEGCVAGRDKAQAGRDHE